MSGVDSYPRGVQELNVRWIADENSERLGQDIDEFRFMRAHQYYQDTYSLADETTPEGAVVAEIGKQLENEKFKGKIHYRVIHHSDVNAFALGDTVYIYSGLLARLQSKAEVAAVLAHELTHIEKGHTMPELKENDDEEEPKTMDEFLARLSRERIFEYTGDAMVAEKLNASGYNPAVQQRILSMLYALSKGRDFTHGSRKDRQSAQLLQFKAKDYESTSGADDSGMPLVLSEEYLAARYQPFLFDRLVEMSSSESENEALLRELENMETRVLLTAHGYLIKRVPAFLETEDFPQASGNAKACAMVDLINRIDGEVICRIRENDPKMTAHEAYRLQILTYTEGMDRDMGDLQSLFEFLDVDADEGRFPSLDYTGKLVKTFKSENDLIAFAESSKGFVLKNADYPDRTFPNNVFVGNRFDFTLRALDEFCQQADYRTRFNCIEKIGEILGGASDSHALQWIRETLSYERDRCAHRVRTIQPLDRTLKREVREQAIIDRAESCVQEIIPIYKEWLSRMERYSTPEEVNSFIKGAAEAMAKNLYAGHVRWRKYIDPTLLGYQKKAKPEETRPEYLQFTAIVERKNASEVVGFLRSHDIRETFQFFHTNRIVQRDPEFAAEIFREFRDFLRGDYVPTSADREMIAAGIIHSPIMVSGLRNVSSQFIREDGSIMADELFLHIGLTLPQIRMFAEMELASKLLIGGDVRIAFDVYLESMSSFADVKMSPETACALMGATTSFAETVTNLGAHQWQRYDNDGSSWTAILQTDVLQASRGSILNQLQKQDITLADKMKLVDEIAVELSHLKRSMTEVTLFGNCSEVGAFVAPLFEQALRDIAVQPIDLSTRDSLEMLYRLVGMFDDDRFASELRGELEYRIVQLLSFDEATEYLRKSIDRRDCFPSKAFEYYQEHLVRTPDQLKKASEIMGSYFDLIHEKGDKGIFALAAIDTAYENLFANHSIEIFEAALESHSDDSKLRALLARVWYQKYVRGNRKYTLTIPTASNQLHEPSIDGGGAFLFVPFETFVQNFYKDLTQNHIDVMLRKLLISREGVLMTPVGRAKTHSMLLGNIHSAESDAGLMRIIDDVAKIGLEEIDPARLYYPLAALLRRQIFIPPVEAGSNKAAIDFVLQSERKWWADEREAAHIGMSSERTRNEAIQRIDYIFKNTPTRNDIKNLLPSSDIHLPDEVKNATLALNGAKAHLTDALEIEQRSIESKMLEPMEVVLEFARNMGAVGVRFLQLLGQYVEIPEHYQSRFDEVYDRIRGQLKFTAFQTLQRECAKPTATNELKEFWSNLQDLSPTLAGGSTMTVYIATMADGHQKIVKILNPNVQEFIRQNIGDMKAVLKKMRSVADTESYDLSAVLIDDMERWLQADIETTDYEKNNQTFEEINNGFTVQTASGVAVEVATPKTISTGTKYVKIEDFVPGTNVSELLQGAGVGVVKPYVEAMRASLARQLTTLAGDGRALVHSDVHIGNARIGEDKKLYWIDRGYYLEMTKEEVGMITPLLEGRIDMISGTKALKYLLGLPENRKVTIDLMKVFSDVMKVVSEAKKGNKSGLSVGNDIILLLKKQGIHIPFQYGLLFKNIRAQAKIEQRVGL